MPALFQVRFEKINNLRIGRCRGTEAESKTAANVGSCDMGIIENERTDFLLSENALAVENRGVVGQARTIRPAEGLFVRPISLIVRGHFKTTLFGAHPRLLDQLDGRANV